MTTEKRRTPYGSKVKRQEPVGLTFKYIHIWASKDEIRVQCTDPQTIRVLIRTVRKEYPDVEEETRTDLADDIYFVRFSDLEPGNQHRQIAWWLFKMLCGQGWEPLSTGDHWYKMTYRTRSTELPWTR